VLVAHAEYEFVPARAQAAAVTVADIHADFGQ
jgi:hypothetical protein